MRNDLSDRPRIRLFRSDLIERATLVTPRGFAISWAIFLSLAVMASWNVAGIAASAGLFVLGLLFWTLFEYAMHRFIFHLRIASPAGQRFIFMTHGNHHIAPGDPMRNIMPPAISIGVSSLVWLGLWLATGPAGSIIFLGFGVGYVVYDGVHYACHQLPMRGPVLRQLRRHHIRHHYAKTEGNYAVTAIFWDRVFGTDVPLKGR